MLLAGLSSASLAADPPAALAAADSDVDLTTLPLEDLLDLEVFSASRFDQKISEAPAAVRVITAAEIRDYGWRTLADALASLPGLYISYDRAYAYLGARGFLRPGDYNTRFLLLVDGSRVNDPVYDQAGIGTDFVLDMDLIDRIEYVPGPGSSGYGTNAFFGVINVVTRSGRDYPGVEARVEAGRDGYAAVAARAGWRWENGELLLAASGFASDGADLYFPEFDTPATNDGIAAGLDDNRVRRFLVKAAHGGLQVSFLHAVRTKGDPTASFGQLFNDPRSQNRDERTLLDVGYRHRLSDDLQLSMHGFAGSYAYDGVFVYEPEPGPLNLDGSRSVWLGFGLQATTTAWARHKVVFGIDTEYDARRDLFNYNTTQPPTTNLDARSNNHRVGVFVEDEFAMRDNLRLNAGLRLDHDGVTGAHVNPRVALIYDPTPSSNIKAIVGTAYRSPNLYETTYTDAYAPAGTALDAERIRSAELVWSQRIGERTTLTASLFDYELRDLIDESIDETSGVQYFSNASRVATRGAEFAIDHVWAQGAVARASYGYARARDRDAEGGLENSPGHLAKVNVSLPVPGTRLRAGIEARYVSSRLGITDRVDDYRLANLNLTWTSADSNLELSAMVHNVFDERYDDPAGPSFVQNAIEQDGRSWLFRVVYRF